MSINDNEPGAEAPLVNRCDAHGEAALTLVESLIHGLISKSILTSEESLDIVDSATDLRAAYAAEAGDAERASGTSEVLLARIAASLRTDIGPIKRDAKLRLVAVVEPSPDAPDSPVVAPPADEEIIR